MATADPPASWSALEARASGDRLSGREPYWEASRRPWTSLLFVLPILLVYEVGVVVLTGSDGMAVRSGADYWLRRLLASLHLSPMLLPVLLVSGLYVWHRKTGGETRVRLETVQGMLGESLLFALLLLLVGRTQDYLFTLARAEAAGEVAHVMSVEAAAQTSAASQTAAVSLAYLGAGIYEEFLFRLCLLPLLYALLRPMLNRGGAAVGAVLLTSLLFTAAHYVGSTGETFDWFTCTFRLTAGLAFSALFVLRGFGITVGCHAVYDLLVGVLRIG